MSQLGKFSLSIMNPDRVIFRSEVESVFLKGDTGEYEVQPFHYPVLGLLTEGDVIVDWKYALAIKKGFVKFFQNECVILVELQEE